VIHVYLIKKDGNYRTIFVINACCVRNVKYVTNLEEVIVCIAEYVVGILLVNIITSATKETRREGINEGPKNRIITTSSSVIGEHWDE
jgi:hypothetical protein